MNEYPDNSLLARARKVYGLDPNIVSRGMLLPYGKTKEGKTELAIPELGVGLLKSFLLPGHVLQGGTYTPEDAMNFTLDYALPLTMRGGAQARAAAKDVGAGAKRFAVNAEGSVPRKGLPMDEASRMARASDNIVDMPAKTFQYKRHYQTLNTRGRARVVMDAAVGERPKGMPRREWQNKVDNPFVVSGTGRYRTGQRFSTKEAAEAYIQRAAPDEYEKLAMQPVGAKQIIEDFLTQRGVKFNRDDAVTTSSSYFRMPGSGLPSIRVADHSRFAGSGGRARAHRGYQLDISPSDKAQLASLLRSLDEYLK